jgi:hypothetical protein
MFNPKHPTVLALRQRGFKVAIHAFFTDERVSVCATGHHADEGLTFHGRSKSGDVEQALNELRRAVGVSDRTNQS